MENKFLSALFYERNGDQYEKENKNNRANDTENS